MKKLIQYHSCFIVDVEIDETNNKVNLLDSSRMRYIYYIDTPEKKDNFSSWLNNVFLIGKAQTLSIFKYHEEGDAPDIDVIIDNFIYSKKEKMILEHI